ncbi:helix-turn-helix domain-containing protein, partial [Streptomyces decoyicus]
TKLRTPENLKALMAAQRNHNTARGTAKVARSQRTAARSASKNPWSAARWLARHPEKQSGSWLGGMRDPVVRDALACVHARPEHLWTTESLAAATAVSRTTLSRHFRSALGQTPGAYVTQWRMDLASVRLRDTDEPVESISGAVGYASPHAFSRAFRRARGMPPGEYRSRLRK